MRYGYQNGKLLVKLKELPAHLLCLLVVEEEAPSKKTLHWAQVEVWRKLEGLQWKVDGAQGMA